MSQHTHGRRQLLICVIAIIVLWCVVLPKLGKTDWMSRWIRRNQQRNIDPSAMFYTELEHVEYRDYKLRYREDHALTK
jgi:hypothetical protein